MDRGDGCWIWDADGHQLLDLVAGDWILIFGHGNPAVKEAIATQLEKGTTTCSPDPELGFEVATQLNLRFPSMERMRFANSGTEAVLHALRIARAATGRSKIAKMRGAYHGTYDPMIVANGKYADPSYAPPGLAPGVIDSTVLLEFNDVERSLAIIQEEHRDLAAVIVEPIHATNGMVPATTKFLQALRSETERYGIVLIFDEVVTFPIGQHGAQGFYGVRPDLTTLGKAVGGGLPLSVFGGRRELMALVDPSLHEGAFGSAPVRHAATTGGISICLAAAAAVLKELTPAAVARLDELGTGLRAGISAMAARTGLPLQATGHGHLFGLHWTAEPVTDIKTATTSNREMLHLANVFLYNAGYYIFQNSLGIVTTPMTPALLEGFVDVWEIVLTEGEAAGWLQM
jgi:glutamate-1-semialdehyde 2,1-aminomutase